MKVGIIGMGMVGGAVAAATTKNCVLATYDKYKPNLSANTNSIFQSDIIFVCVPTPTNQGVQDIAELITVCLQLSQVGFNGVVAVKSTVLPGTMGLLQKRFTDLRLVHNPEFLSEKTAHADFKNQKDVLVSGNMKDAAAVTDYCFTVGINANIWYNADFTVTEAAKYIHNCSLPVILSLLNEMYDVFGDEVYKDAIEMAHLFGNVPRHHKVPGPDGLRGWGGMCFPKDTIAFYIWARSKGHKMPTLNGSLLTNLTHRSEEMRKCMKKSGK